MFSGQVATAVIVAAGVASRLRPYSLEMPKGLMELREGLSIVEWNISKLRKAGLKNILVVTRSEFAETFKGKLRGQAVVLVVGEAPEFGNLYTVYTALRHVEPPFLVVMSDHIFEDAILAKLLSRKSGKAFTVCLDRKPPRPDLHEGLQLVIKDGEVKRVGKGAGYMYGIDTGLILFREKARRYVEEAINAKGPTASIGDALDLAARDGELDYVDVTGLYWKDIDTPEDLAEARARLTQLLRRDALRTNDILSRLLTRPITSLIASRLSGFNPSLTALALGSLSVPLYWATLLLAGSSWQALLPALLLAYAALALVDAGEALHALTGSSNARVAVWFSSTLVDALLVSSLIRTDPLWTSLLISSLSLCNAMREGSGLLVTISSRSLRWLVTPIFFLGTGSPAPVFLEYLYLAQGLVALAGLLHAIFRERVAAPRRRERERPRPKVEIPHVVVRRHLESIVNSGIALVFIFIIIDTAKGSVGGFPLAEIYARSITVADLLSLAELMALLYYGYRILASVKFFVDLAVDRVARAMKITQSMAMHMLVDVFYVVIGWVLAALVAPLVKSLPLYGSMLSAVVSLIGVSVLAFFLYDLARQLQRVFSDIYTSFSEKIVRHLGGEEQ
ncbi:phosphocholine cytidylyltransferase family protein [Infirmifilum sp. NZ]|uniref:phosphocholine cytidylyltransferase family protein n=1 Tax=Infirmifilum sp. NZ TaxID=2926850 RepID=UPI0027995610|nr:NTP transferase domain-containing protein [Infirmifilum sp. NZ]UNQ73674.1 NTP transferase domain-containing protein [Infirmifilum sp. NZ]